MQSISHQKNCNNKVRQKDFAEFAPPSRSDPVDGSSVFANGRYANCLFECQLELAAGRCGCLPWDYPRLNGSFPLCTLSGAGCFSDALGLVRDPRLCRHCLVDCATVTYTYKVSATPIDASSLCIPSNWEVGTAESDIVQ